ncbi:MAG: amino acid permease [Petrimonas sp.]|jgi:arginine:ornithine antiporter/lysine permease|nr:MAG: putative arginine/ornithine antiporter [Bacteroidetes bacterium ADurb.BinA174]
MKQQKQLGLWLLVFVSLGSMIGSGIFNSPKDLINVANPMGTLITWIIGGTGALMLALVFIYLSAKKPELKSGIYAYARNGFGDYMGFNSAWGYWSLGWLGNISYLVLFFKTLNDLLGEYALSPLTCFILGSAILWLYYFILLSGVREGAILNFVVTVAKLVPIALVILLGIWLVNNEIFNVPDWQTKLASNGKSTTPLLQVKDAMAVVLWCFVGIEAAAVLSGRAKSQQTVRKAITISVLSVLTIYMLVTFVAMASVPAKDLVASDTPISLVLGKTIIGSAGSLIVKVGIMISVLGASLSWIILSVETMYASAREGVMPKALAKTNKKGTPVNALLLTQIFTQVFLLSILSPAFNETYLMVITIGTTMVLIPYLLSSLYAVKISFGDNREKNINKLIAVVGTLYSTYVIYAVGIKYLFLSIIFYAIGAIIFLKGRREQKLKPKHWEWAFMLTLIVAAILLVILIAKGTIRL